jgi:hypothetical protein
MLFDLRIKKSGIPNSGKGLFTTKRILKNKNIAKYTGDIKTLEDYNLIPGGTYGLEITRGRVLDASSTQSGIARYANDCREQARKMKKCKGINSRFVVSNRGGHTTVWLRSTKNIAVDDEIYVSYGRKYWS